MGTTHADDADESDDADMKQLRHKELTDQVLNAFFMVYNDHGYGYLESVYCRSLAVELSSRDLVVQREVETEITYKGVPVGLYRADMVIERKVLVETKANVSLSAADERQVLNYLKATRLEVGLLLNFGPKPAFKRLVFTQSASSD